MIRNENFNASSLSRTLTEDDCNIHEIFANENSILFDLLMPPYTENEGPRGCHYFKLGIRVLAPGGGPSSPQQQQQYTAAQTTALATRAASSSPTSSLPPPSIPHLHQHPRSSSPPSPGSTMASFITLTLPKPPPGKAPLAFLAPQTRVLLLADSPTIDADNLDYIGPRIDEDLIGGERGSSQSSASSFTSSLS